MNLNGLRFDCGFAFFAFRRRHRRALGDRLIDGKGLCQQRLKMTGNQISIPGLTVGKADSISSNRRIERGTSLRRKPG